MDSAVETELDSVKLHAKTLKEIERHGPQMVFNNRINMAESAAEHGSSLAEGLKKEASKIAKIYGLNGEDT